LATLRMCSCGDGRPSSTSTSIYNLLQARVDQPSRLASSRMETAPPRAGRPGPWPSSRHYRSLGRPLPFDYPGRGLLYRRVWEGRGRVETGVERSSREVRLKPQSWHPPAGATVRLRELRECA
jgi:hypothetical protein